MKPKEELTKQLEKAAEIYEELITDCPEGYNLRFSVHSDGGVFFQLKNNEDISKRVGWLEKPLETPYANDLLRDFKNCFWEIKKDRIKDEALVKIGTLPVDELVSLAKRVGV